MSDTTPAGAPGLTRAEIGEHLAKRAAKTVGRELVGRWRAHGAPFWHHMAADIDAAIAAARREEAGTRERWIDVRARLPEVGEQVLLALSCGDVVQGLLWESDPAIVWEWAHDEGNEDRNYAAVTHWMPWPAPPSPSRSRSYDDRE